MLSLYTSSLQSTTSIKISHTPLLFFSRYIFIKQANPSRATTQLARFIMKFGSSKRLVLAFTACEQATGTKLIVMSESGPNKLNHKQDMKQVTVIDPDNK